MSTIVHKTYLIQSILLIFLHLRCLLKSLRPCPMNMFVGHMPSLWRDRPCTYLRIVGIDWAMCEIRAAWRSRRPVVSTIQISCKRMASVGYQQPESAPSSRPQQLTGTVDSTLAQVSSVYHQPPSGQGRSQLPAFFTGTLLCWSRWHDHRCS